MRGEKNLSQDYNKPWEGPESKNNDECNDYWRMDRDTNYTCCSHPKYINVCFMGI